MIQGIEASTILLVGAVDKETARQHPAERWLMEDEIQQQGWMVAQTAADLSPLDSHKQSGLLPQPLGPGRDSETHVTEKWDQMQFVLRFIFLSCIFSCPPDLLLRAA